MIKRLVTGLTVLAAAATLGSPVTSATASTPSSLPLTNNEIVVMKSVGGFTLGDDFADAKQRMSAPDCFGTECSQTSHGDILLLLRRHDQVAGVAVIAQSLARTSVGGLSTDTGLGIGSRQSQVTKTFPHATLSRLDDTLHAAYMFRDHRKLVTLFYLRKHLVTGVAVVRFDKPIKHSVLPRTRTARTLARLGTPSR